MAEVVARVRWWRPALLVALLVVGAVVAFTVGVPPIEDIRSAVAAAGWAGPALYAAAYVALSLTPTPASVLSIGAGVLFGFAVGVPLVLVSAVVGAAGGFAIGRGLGRDTVFRWQGRLVERGGVGAVRLAQLDDLLGRDGLLAMIGVRFVPILPFAVMNIACGLTSIRTRDYLLGSAIGMAPGVIGLVGVGAYGGDPLSLPFLLSVGGLLVLVTSGALVARRRHSHRRRSRRRHSHV